MLINRSMETPINDQLVKEQLKKDGNFTAICGIEDDLFFVLRDNKVGIIDSGGSFIIPLEYDIMTYPVNGYYLGFKFTAPYRKNSSMMYERIMDRKNYCYVYLFHAIKQDSTPHLVFSKQMARDYVLMNIAEGYYLFHPIENESGLKSLSVKALFCFDEDFATKISLIPQLDSPQDVHSRNRILGRNRQQKASPIYWFPPGEVCPYGEYYSDRMLQKSIDEIEKDTPPVSKRHYTEFQGTRAQEEGGYSDEDIYDIFDGNPDAYGNIE